MHIWPASAKRPFWFWAPCLFSTGFGLSRVGDGQPAAAASTSAGAPALNRAINVAVIVEPPSREIDSVKKHVSSLRCFRSDLLRIETSAKSFYTLKSCPHNHIFSVALSHLEGI